MPNDTTDGSKEDSVNVVTVSNFDWYEIAFETFASPQEADAYIDKQNDHAFFTYNAVG